MASEYDDLRSAAEHAVASGRTDGQDRVSIDRRAYNELADALNNERRKGRNRQAREVARRRVCCVIGCRNATLLGRAWCHEHA